MNGKYNNFLFYSIMTASAALLTIGAIAPAMAQSPTNDDRATIEEIVVTAHIDSLRAVIRAWRRLDIDTVLSYVHDDITFNNSGGQKPALRGKVEMRAALETFAEIVKEGRWRLFAWHEIGDTVWMEGVEEFVTHDGKRVVIPYAGVLEFQDGLILNWREYFSDGLMNQLMNGEAVPAHVDAFIDRPEV